MQLFSWPVFSREVRGFLRSRKAFWCLFLFLGILLFFLLGRWSQFARAWSSDAYRTGLDTSLAGKYLFYTLASGQLFILTILTPFLTAPAIAAEYERATLGLLVSSPVSFSLILIQKLVSSMAFLVLLLVGAAPVMALCFLAGGLSGQEVVGAYMILLGACLMYGSVGLACSTFGRRVYEVYLLREWA
jgi:ABC-type transport system involved in multi-copper enzyme maturation permease subunit